MNELQLSIRLEKVASYIPPNSILADIGSDHAYLPCYAYLNGLVERAIAGEVNEGPFLSAKEQVKKVKLEEKIDVRKGDGLGVVSPNEVTCITIAGMGGSLITKILEDGKEKLAGVTRLILQPNIGAINIREWLLEEKWQLIAETILEEDGKIYEILVAEKGNPYLPYNQEDLQAGILLGPFLIQEKSPVFIKKWQHELLHWKKIIENLHAAEMTDANQQRKKELQQKINIVEEVLS